MSEETKPPAEGKSMCPHCGHTYMPLLTVVPTHSWPKPTRQVCPGSGQKARKPDDPRVLWNGKPNPHLPLPKDKKPISEFRIPPDGEELLTADDIEAAGIIHSHTTPKLFLVGLPDRPWGIYAFQIPKTATKRQLALFCEALGVKPKEVDDGPKT